MKKKDMISALLILLIVISSVSAYENLCLGYGDEIKYSECNPLIPDYTCWHDSCINICVDEISEGVYCPAYGKCNGIGCSTLGNTTLDVTPPNLTVNSPINEKVYSSRAVLFDIETNEPSSLYYIDNINGIGRELRLSSNTQSYLKSISFDDGFNNITIKATDRHNNFIEIIKTFYVDSKSPKISKTYPKKGFSDGSFEVEFKEENPENLTLHYGIPSDMREHEVNISECSENRGRYNCQTDVDLTDYDGQDIEYWFELIDIAGSFDESKPVEIKVDYSDPVILNLSYRIDKKYVYFYVEINEANFDEMTYVDLGYSKPRAKRLCSRLINNICEKKVSFKDGNHDVSIQIIDEAGNSIAQSVQFFTDSKKPIINRAYPKKGFTNGMFEVEFKEENPENLTLRYGTSSDMREYEVDIDSCSENRDKYNCQVDVDLTDFNGQEIKYWFKLEDKVGNVDIDKYTYLLQIDKFTCSDPV